MIIAVTKRITIKTKEEKEEEKEEIHANCNSQRD